MIIVLIEVNISEYKNCGGLREGIFNLFGKEENGEDVIEML